MTRRMYYFGPSMNPILQLGDGLMVAPYAGREPRVGDVVVYANPDIPGEHVVHRVVAVAAGGLRTQGDNCPAPDPWVVPSGDLIGYVAAVHRQGRTFTVDQHYQGKIMAWQIWSRLDLLLSGLIRPLYRRLAATTPLRGWLTPRLLTFERAGGREWQLWLGPWLIGRRLPHWQGWYIKRPFGLCVDESELP